MPPRMKKDRAKAVMERLLQEIEEEDIGMSLLATYSGVADELLFFKAEDRARILKILKKLSDDSRRHKKILVQIIDFMGKCYEK